MGSFEGETQPVKVLLDTNVTRNPNDFAVTSPRIMTPQQLIQEFTNSE
jgi:hypothetical protein